MTTINQFYQLGHDSSFNPQFAWGYKIIPQSEEKLLICPKCKTVRRIPIGAFDIAVEGGEVLPDILGSGSYPFFIVSTRVVQNWKSNDVDDFLMYPVSIIKNNSDLSVQTESSKYYRIEPTGICQIDLLASGLEVIQYCPECHYLKTRPTLPRRFEMNSGSWDGSTIFRDPNLYPQIIFCTHKIVEIAHRFQHTNFRFEFMSGLFNYAQPGLEYLSTLPN